MSCRLVCLPCFPPSQVEDGVGATTFPRHVSKVSVVELHRGKNTADYSQVFTICVFFFVLGQHLTQFSDGKCQIFAEKKVFLLKKSISQTIFGAKYDYHQCVPHSISHRMCCFGTLILYCEVELPESNSIALTGKISQRQSQ